MSALIGLGGVAVAAIIFHLSLSICICINLPELYCWAGENLWLVRKISNSVLVSHTLCLISFI